MLYKYYSVIEKLSEYPPKTLISFTNKAKALDHIRLLNKAGGNYSLLESEVQFITPILTCQL